MSFSKPKTPAPTPEQVALERNQREQLTTLDSQENQRRKRLLSAQQGGRAFAGSALFRNAQSLIDTSRAAAATAPRTAASDTYQAPISNFTGNTVFKPSGPINYGPFGGV